MFEFATRKSQKDRKGGNLGKTLMTPGHRNDGRAIAQFEIEGNLKPDDYPIRALEYSERTKIQI